jgi:DNA-binding SARP family transcriptional activator/TolB-like protein
MYRLRLFGGVFLEGPSGPVSGKAVQRRQLALLAMLSAGNDGGWSRDKLVGCLWPESDQEGARHRLSGSLYELRKALGDDVVLAAGESLRLNPGAVSTDVADFEAALEAGDLEEAADLYLGPFLDGFYLGGAREFDSWLESERQRLRLRYESAVEQLADGAETAEDYPRAVALWQKLSVSDHYNSRFVLRLMQAMAAAGDPANALQIAREHERLLRDELDMEPAPDVVKLARQLKESPPPAARSAIGVTATPADSASTPTRGLATTESGGAHRFLTSKDALLAGVIAATLISVIISGYVAIRVFGFGAGDSLISTGVLQPRERIVLSDFVDRSAHADLSAAVTELFRIDLAQSPSIRLAESSYVASVVRRMERDPEAPLDVSLAREVAVRQGLKAVIAGEINSAGGSIVISAQVVTADSGLVLWADREVATDPDSVIPATDRLSRRMRRGIGESLRNIRSGPHLPQVTTSSLEALQKYSEALSIGLTDRLSTIALLDEAIALDSTFAMAWRKLGVYAGAFDRAAGEAYTKAFQLRHRLTDRERYLTEGTYYQSVTGEKEKAAVAYRRLLDRYPDVYEARGNLGSLYSSSGDLAAAEELYHQGIELDSTLVGIWRYLLGVQYRQHKFDEAEETLRHIERLFPDYPSTPWLAAHLAFSRGGYAAAEERLEEMIEKHGAIRTWSVSAGEVLGSIYVVQGRLREAEARIQRTRDADAENGAIRAYLMHTGGVALIAQLRGDVEAGLAEVNAALERYPLEAILPRSRPYTYLARTYALYLGRTDIARGLLADYERDLDASIRERRRADWHDAVGVVLMAEGRWQEAIEEFRAEYAISSSRTGAPAFLARTFDRAGVRDSAIAYYEHYVNTPTLYRAYGDHFHLPIAYERLGRLYQDAGDTEKAIFWHQKFVDLWQEADPELQPRVEAARREIAALSAGG